MGRAFLARAALCLLIGFVLLVPGTGIVVSGWTGSIAGTPQEVLSPTAALVAPATGLFGRSTSSRSLTPQVRVDLAVTPGPQPAFVGLARAADLARYLGSTPVDVMSEVAGPGATHSYALTRLGSGPPRPLPAPAAQGFWIDTATGGDARAIDWVSASDRLELVVMNADGSAGMDQRLAPSIFLISARPLAIVMVFGGALAVLFGVLYLMARRGSDGSAPAVDIDQLAPERGS